MTLEDALKWSDDRARQIDCAVYRAAHVNRIGVETERSVLRRWNRHGVPAGAQNFIRSFTLSRGQQAA